MRWTRCSRTRYAASLAAVALAATACGGSPDEPTGQPAADDAPADEEPAAGDEPEGEAAPTEDGAEGSQQTLTVYSGRSEELVGEVLDDFTEDTGIDLEVRYGDTAELAATIVNEGEASPADVYWAQDAGALGALEAEQLLAELDNDTLERVDEPFRSSADRWVGVTGRVRVIAHSTERVADDELPDSVFELTDPEWEGRVGWAPTNGSFQAFVTAMRVTEGEDTTREWLEDMLANDPQVYENNSSQLEAIERGEIDLGLVNHYYLYRFLAEDEDFPVDNHFLPGDIGGLVNVAGVGTLASSEQPDAAGQLVTYLLSEDAQSYFGQVTDELEYPLVDDVEAGEDLPPLDELDPPAVDLSDLEDLQGTIELLSEVGATA